MLICESKITLPLRDGERVKQNMSRGEKECNEKKEDGA
jgi:hypothetical protein